VPTLKDVDAYAYQYFKDAMQRPLAESQEEDEREDLKEINLPAAPP
jgi:hypothetical protein